MPVINPSPVATQRAYLVWQNLWCPECDFRNQRIENHAVAEFRQNGDSVEFRYLEDRLPAAIEQGFYGYPGLAMDSDRHRHTAIKSMRRRVPPRSRGDFDEMLERLGLPKDWDFTTLSLVAYTGARRISDYFWICETFDGFDEPFTYVFELADTKLDGHPELCAELLPGEPMRFEREAENADDPGAIRVVRASDGKPAGYIQSLQEKIVGRWLDEGEIEASMFRFNGVLDHPRLYVRADVVPSTAAAS